MYFDDLPVGYSFETTSKTLTREAIIGFAETWDPQAFHLDEEAARASIYGGLIASGFQTMMTAFVLTVEAGVWTNASMGSPGMDEIRWRLPVRPGDTLWARGTVLSSTPSTSRPDRGRTVIGYEVHNQKDEIVMSYSATHILRRLPN